MGESATAGTNSGGNFESSSFTGMTNEFWEGFANYMKSQKGSENTRLSGKNDNTCWLIDSGAINHMIGDFEILKDVQEITPCPIFCQMAKEHWQQNKGQ